YRTVLSGETCGVAPGGYVFGTIRLPRRRSWRGGAVIAKLFVVERRRIPCSHAGLGRFGGNISVSPARLVLMMRLPPNRSSVGSRHRREHVALPTKCDGPRTSTRRGKGTACRGPCSCRDGRQRAETRFESGGHPPGIALQNLKEGQVPVAPGGGEPLRGHCRAVRALIFRTGAKRERRGQTFCALRGAASA